MPEQVEVSRTSLRQRIGLGSQLSLLLAVAILLLTLLLVLLVGRFVGKQFRHAVGQGLAARASQAAAQLDSGMFERYRELQLLSRRAEQGAGAGALSRRVLDDLQRTYPLYAWLGVTDNDGTVLAASGGVDEGSNLASQAWWQAAPSGMYVHDVHAIAPEGRADGIRGASGSVPRQVLELAFPYFDGAGRQAGILGAQLDWNWARQIVGGGDGATPGGTETLIVARDGRMLLGPPAQPGPDGRRPQGPQWPAAPDAAQGRGALPAPDALPPAARAGQSVGGRSLAQAQLQAPGYVVERADGRDYLVGYARTRGYEGYPGLGWVVLVRQDMPAVLAPVRRLQAALGLAGSAAALLLSLLAWRAARRFTVPLLQATQALRAAEPGQAALPPSQGSYAELDVLCAASNAQLEQLRGAQREARQACLALERRLEEQGAALEQSRASLHASEARLQALLAASQEAYIGFDSAGTVCDWSGRAEHVFGWPRAEALGKRIEQLLQAEAGQLAGIAASGRVALGAWRRDGGRFAAELALVALPGTAAGGALPDAPAWAALVSDISQRQRIEQELEAERLLLATVLETIEVAVMACGPQGEATLSNRAARALPAGAVQPGEVSLLRRALGGEHVQGEELRIIAADGSERHLLCNGSALAGADGSRLGAVVAMADVSALEQAKLALADKERFLRAVADNNPAAIGYVDHNEIYRFANRSYQSMMGIDPASMIGRSIEQVLGETVYGQVRGHVAAALRGERVHFEVDTDRPGWPRHFMTDYIPDTDPQGVVRGFHIMVLDITLRKRAELQQQEAARAKSAFLANMSHEIRTPMNAVLGLGQLLERTPLNAEQQEYVRLIRASGSSLLALVNDILDLSKIEAGKLAVVAAPFQLDELAEAIAGAMQAASVGKQLDLLLTVEPGTPQGLVGDLPRLRQVALNLVGNAIKFTAEGAVSVHIGASAPGSAMEILQLTVRDSGIGMSSEQLGRLFHPFEQGDQSTARRFGGTGLGLSISQQLVDLMGGTITVSSEAGRGSEFVVSVPLQLALRQRAEEGAGALSGLRVLLVDDHVPTLRYLEGLLRRWGCSVDAHAAAPAADGAAWDVALVDSALLDAEGAAPYAGMALVALNRSLDRPPGAGEIAALAKPVLPGALRLLLQGLRQQQAVRDAAPVVLPRLATLRGARILLVEDNATNQLVARGVLEPAGALVTVAENGQEAVDLVRAGPAVFDLVLMDVQMPVMDGFEATRMLRGELGLRIPILAMSAGVLETEQARCLECGMDGFIAKPVDYADMLGTIAAHLSRHAAASGPAPQGADGACSEDDAASRARSAAGGASSPGAIHAPAPTSAAGGTAAAGAANAPARTSAAGGLAAAGAANTPARTAAAGGAAAAGAAAAGAANAPAPAVAEPDAGHELDLDLQPGVFAIRKLLAVIGHGPQRQNIVALVGRVVRQSQAEFDAARARWQEGDAAGAAAALHALRGGVGSLGARNFADATLAVEQALRGADAAAAARYFESAQRALGATLEAAARWLRQEQPAADAVQQDWQAAMQRLADLLRRQDLDALTQFRQMRAQLAGRHGAGAAAQLESAIEALDFGAALEVLNEDAWKAPS